MKWFNLYWSLFQKTVDFKKDPFAVNVLVFNLYWTYITCTRTVWKLLKHSIYSPIKVMNFGEDWHTYWSNSKMKLDYRVNVVIFKTTLKLLSTIINHGLVKISNQGLWFWYCWVLKGVTDDEELIFFLCLSNVLNAPDRWACASLSSHRDMV